MRVLFLNQYGPPDPSPTARLLGELGDFLRTRGHEVRVVSQPQDYHGRPAGGRGRLKREMKALLTVWRVGGSVAGEWRPDLVLALSSPPGLLVAAAWIAWRRGVPLATWAMDLYPELAVALGEVKPGVVPGVVGRLMGWAYRRAALVVALDDDMREHLRRRYGVEARVMPPWAALTFERQAREAGGEPQEGVWLYSGNLGRAHEWETLLAAQALLEKRGVAARLVFQGDGAARKTAMARAEELGLKRCEWTGYVEEGSLPGSLRGARVLVVTQRPETQGLLWPSKLAALEILPRAVLFVGPVDGAIARRLRARGNAGVFAPGDAEGVAGWVEGEAEGGRQKAKGKRQKAEDEGRGAAGEEGCATLERWLAECAGR